jgi:predicted RNase H-like HicB family nuclease
MKTQKKYILDFRVIIKPDQRTGSNKPCYVAHCPTLGIADDGDTVEEALKNIRDTIIFHLQCLQEEGKEVPVDHPHEELVTNTQVQIALPKLRLAI